jgi:hypothetical protein
MLSELAPVLTLADNEIKTIAIFGVMGSVAVIWIISATIFYTMKTKYREQTKRELAAYVAEGTISPDDAAKLLSADEDEIRKKIADGVAWGTINAKDAKVLMGSGGPKV